MRHAGARCAASKCATCHKGTGGRPAQHSSSVTKKYVLRRLPLQEAARQRREQAVKNCRTCHSGKYHAAQTHAGQDRLHALPHVGACATPTASSARLCHRRAVHSHETQRDQLRPALNFRLTTRGVTVAAIGLTVLVVFIGVALAATSSPRFCSSCKSHVPYVDGVREVGAPRRQLRAVPHQAGAVLLPHVQARGPAAADRPDHRRLREAHPRLRAQPVVPPLPHQRDAVQDHQQERHPRQSRAPHRGRLPLPALPLHHGARRRRARGLAHVPGHGAVPDLPQQPLQGAGRHGGHVALRPVPRQARLRRHARRRTSRATGARATAPSACSPPAAPATSRRTPAPSATAASSCRTPTRGSTSTARRPRRRAARRAGSATTPRSTARPATRCRCRIPRTSSPAHPKQAARYGTPDVLQLPRARQLPGVPRAARRGRPARPQPVQGRQVHARPAAARRRRRSGSE